MSFTGGRFSINMTVAVRFYVVGVSAIAVACLALAGWSVPIAGVAAHWNAMAAFIVLGFLSEAFYLRLRVGQGETNASVAFIPFLASILLFDTGWAILIAALAELAVEYAVRKKPAIRIVFNVSQVVVAVALASWAFHAIGGQSGLSSYRFNPAAIAAAVLVYFLVNSTAVSVAVALGDQVAFRKAWSRIGGASLFYDFVSSPLAALLAFLYFKWQLPGILLLVVPIWFVRHSYQVNIQLEQVNRDLLELMAKTIEARDPYTSGHSLRVAQIAEQIANECGVGGRAVEQIRTAALLHDVGKIHEDFAPLLHKNAKLDATETALMQTHPSRSAELVSTISAYRGPIEAAVRHHHERYDGSGYPLGLSGSSIPLSARIIMVADTMDSMTTNRPYRVAMSYARVISELESCAGAQFDPALVEIAVKSKSIRALVTSRPFPQTDRAFPRLEVLTSMGRAAARA
ncbi:MAG: HD domain-containing protein [Planctomycetia bacterium]|nr:HD domain-containing protein [Planctomycetia bacterium]